MATIKNPNATIKPQQGYGVGYLDNNVGGGFNQFNNFDAVGTEIGRMNTVMQNRTQQNLGNSAQQGYMDKLNTAYKPMQQQQQNVTNAQNSYNNSQQRADASNMNNATIADIATKYGFDYSRNYAKTQAESEAQALRNANQDAQRRNESNKKTGLQSIDNNLMNMAEGLDRNYFQQMMGQQQNQVNSGLNAGIAADQDLRLQMNRQAEMGASYRDANLGRMQINENFNLDDIRLAEAMGLIDQQALARTDSLYNDRLQQGFGNLMTERNMANQLDQQQWGRSQTEIDRALGQQSELRNAGQWQTQFDYGQQRDNVADNQWNQQFDYGKQRDQVADGQWNQQFDWSKLMDTANQTGIFNGQRNMQGQQFDWSKQVDQHGMSMAEKQFALQQQNAAAQRAAASKSGSGVSSSSAPASTPTSLGQQFQKEQQSIPQTPADKVWMQSNKAYDDIMSQMRTNSGREPDALTKKTFTNLLNKKAQQDAYFTNMMPFIYR